MMSVVSPLTYFSQLHEAEERPGQSPEHTLFLQTIQWKSQLLSSGVDPDSFGSVDPDPEDKMKGVAEFNQQFFLFRRKFYFQ